MPVVQHITRVEKHILATLARRIDHRGKELEGVDDDHPVVEDRLLGHEQAHDSLDDAAQQTAEQEPADEAEHSFDTGTYQAWPE